MKTGFFDYFPTPKFLEMPSPGLSMTEKGLHLVEFSRTKTGLTLHKTDSLIFNDNYISEGAIVKPQELIHALETFRKKNDLHYIRTSLPEERAYLFSTVVPSIAGEDLRSSVEATIEENVPLSVSEAVFDYTIVGPEPFQGRPGMKVTVSVLPEKVVSEYLNIFRSSGFEPFHFEIESQAIAKAILPKDDKRVCLIINVGSNKVGFYISDASAVSFTSTVTVNVPATGPYGEFGSEVKKIFLYWQAQSDRKNEKPRPITHILLVGERGAEPGLAEFLTQTFEVQASVADVWQNAFSLRDYIPEISKKDSLVYATAIGLALHRRTQ